MAQNFRRYALRSIGTTAADAPDGTDFNSYDTIIGIHLANRTTNMVKATVFITDYNNDSDDDPTDNAANTYYLIKDAPIAAGGALQLMDGGAKVVVQDGDRLWIQSDTANSIDAWVSVVDAIST
tara:strand:- start:563 stop:934 length:372 start_codon:yes stop_codon:yes gene_type:complete